MPAVELEALEELLRPCAIPPRIKSGLKINQLANGERRVEMRLLRHIPDPNEHAGVLLGHRKSQDCDAAAEGT